MSEAVDKAYDQYMVFGLRGAEAEAAVAILLGQSILLARLGALEAVAVAARACVAAWRAIGAGTGFALCDETQALANALSTLDAGEAGAEVEVSETPHYDALLESYWQYVERTERRGLAPPAPEG